VQRVQRAVRDLAIRQDVDQGAVGELVADQPDGQQADATPADDGLRAPSALSRSPRSCASSRSISSMIRAANSA
jgi:hypothetical protein